MKHFPISILIWTLPAPFISLICGIAIFQGNEHPWIWMALITAMVLSILSAIFATGLSMALQSQASFRDEEYQRIHESYQQAENSRRQLQNEVEHLSGMHSINMSSQIENFSELLKNALTITHFSTEAKALTLFLESTDLIGSIFPKAHIRWETEQHQTPSMFYAYFDGEVVLSHEDDHVISGFRYRDNNLPDEKGQLSGDLLYKGRQVGYFKAPAFQEDSADTEKLISTYIQDLDLTTHGALSAWQSRTGNNFSLGTDTFINIPIVSQNTVIGVLQAEFGGVHGEKRSMEDVVKLQGLLRDITVTIGQPLRKEQLYEQATKDSLTGLYNKALYTQQLHDHFHRCQRYQRPLAYIFLDIDHFKLINDRYGHLTGDIALKSVARIIIDNIRQSDLAFRFGGEELCVLLPESSEEDGIAVAEKLREIIENYEFPTDKDFTIRFTASFGVACSNLSMREPSELAKLADEAVYQAKRSGRNRVIASSGVFRNIE
jgi:diguanylate cyclase (GGDEF)-like protein